MRSSASPRSRMVNDGSRPMARPCSRSRRVAVAWKVPPQTLPDAGGRAWEPPGPCARLLAPGAVSASSRRRMPSTRRSISAGGAPGEGEQQDAARVGAGGDAVGHAMGQRGRLARAGAGHDQQRFVAVQHCRPLLLVQTGQDRPDGRAGQGVIHFDLQLSLLWYRSFSIQGASDRTDGLPPKFA